MIKEIIEWSNNNQGIIAILIFFLSIVIAWVSGFFKYLRSNPKFKIEILEQCTFYCVFDLCRTHNGLPVHKTAFVLYVRITNVGKSASSIGDSILGYNRNEQKLKIFNCRNWVKETIAKEDFKSELGSKIKVYPFLRQKSTLMPGNNNTYLRVGQSENGMIYFEEKEAYGSFMPKPNKDGKTTNVKLVIYDAFGKKHKQRFNLPSIEPEEAFKHNNYFGQTYNEYQSKKD